MKKAPESSKTVADFFAGIGLVTMGLERAGWKTVYALDYDEQKKNAYTHHFGEGHFHMEDIANTEGTKVPNVTLAHASFPCTDLSVAGGRGGIHKGESSAFWHFARILNEMSGKHGNGRPPLVLLENVEGLLTSDAGQDLHKVLKTLNELDYHVDLLRVDASHFVPQSRVRLFMIGVHKKLVKKLNTDALTQQYQMKSSNARPEKIVNFIESHPGLKWYFHPLPNLPLRQATLDSIVDTTESWWSKERAEFAFNQMHSRHQRLIEERLHSSDYSYFAAFRRMRVRDGESRSTLELRTDGIAGCLRTPKGGSAKQIIVRVGRGAYDVRLINGREAARLMGADDFSILPNQKLDQTLFGFGDAVCVPAVEWIATHYFNSMPLEEWAQKPQVRPVARA